MAEKIRVYELAKENNMVAKDMVKLLKDEFGLDIKSHMSMVGGSDLELIQGYFDEINEEKMDKKNNKHNKNKGEKKHPKNLVKAEDIIEDEELEEEKPKKKRKKKNKNKKSIKPSKKQVEEKKTGGIIEIPETVNVKTFADKIGESPNAVIALSLIHI